MKSSTAVYTAPNAARLLYHDRSEDLSPGVRRIQPRRDRVRKSDAPAACQISSTNAARCRSAATAFCGCACESCNFSTYHRWAAVLSAPEGSAPATTTQCAAAAFLSACEPRLRCGAACASLWLNKVSVVQTAAPRALAPANSSCFRSSSSTKAWSQTVVKCSTSCTGPRGNKPVFVAMSAAKPSATRHARRTNGRGR